MPTRTSVWHANSISILNINSRHALASGPWLVRAGRVGGSEPGASARRLMGGEHAHADEGMAREFD